MRIRNPHCFAVALRSGKNQNKPQFHELRNNLSNSPCSWSFTRYRTFGRMLAFFRRTYNVGSTRLHVALSRHVSYVQGQSPSPKVREYFYYIDHQGQVLYFTNVLFSCLIYPVGLFWASSSELCDGQNYRPSLHLYVNLRVEVVTTVGKMTPITIFLYM